MAMRSLRPIPWFVRALRWMAAGALTVALLPALSCRRYRPSGEPFSSERYLDTELPATAPSDGSQSEVPSPRAPSSPATSESGQELSDPSVSAGDSTPGAAAPSEAAGIQIPRLSSPANPEAFTRREVGREFEPVYFDSDSPELRYTARRSIFEYAKWLGENPQVWITLGGHSDGAAARGYGYNLAMARAWAVKERLVGLGVPEDRLFTIGYGQDRPAVQGRSAEQNVLNRRVEFAAFIAPRGGVVLPPANPADAPPPIKPTPQPPHSAEIE